MEKNTIIAIVLSGAVLTFGMFILPRWVSLHKEPVVSTQITTKDQELQHTTREVSYEIQPVKDEGQLIEAQTFEIETEVFNLLFSNEGAIIRSIKLKHHKDVDGPVQMVYSKMGPGAAFETRFGLLKEPSINIPFHYVRVSPLVHQFSKKFVDSKGNKFLFSKTFSLSPDEYIIQLDIAIQAEHGILPVLLDESYAYSLTYGPQIGPKFTVLDGAQEFRKYIIYSHNKRSEEALSNETKAFNDPIKWAAIVGKYFTVIGIPDSTIYRTSFSNKTSESDQVISKLSFTRPLLKSSYTQDTFRFYIGPKEEAVLKKYNEVSSNSFGLSNLRLERAMEDNFLFGWLEFLLKKALMFFYLLIPNWGIGIILLTIAVKLLTWPLTTRSYRSSASLQVLQPQMKVLQEKYKDDPKKLNEQMLALYRKEGVNPLVGGCLPMLLQIPIFFALYGLFNNQFDLRGAMFIPGWIPDLSAPDIAFQWGFPLPLLQWTALHLLPFIMVGTQIGTSLLTQPTGRGMNSQMKIMAFGIPFLFFFITYHMPSGLMLYWCIQNILTMIQQLMTNMNYKERKNDVKPIRKSRRTE